MPNQTRRIDYLVFKWLGKTDLDVLEDADDNKTHTYIALGINRKEWIDELGQGAIDWVEEGGVGTISTTLDISAVPSVPGYPAQALKINIQGGARGPETKLTLQRQQPLKTWGDPVRAHRPPEDEAIIFLLRDDVGAIHARYVESASALPPELLARIEGVGRQYGAINFSEEGGVVLESALLARIIETLRHRHNVILYGPPGTGKTWLMTEVDKVFHEGITPIIFDPTDLNRPFKQGSTHNITEKTNRYSEFVIFHQSTSYEAFVAGLRPFVDAKGRLSYDIEKGPFFDLAEHASKDDAASLLLIDEINRGNTAEIFGELITVLEPDKRLSPNGVRVEYKTVTPRLPYAPDSDIVEDGCLLMPYFFFTLASMNSVDRTVAPLDSALRRRFQIIQVAPDLGLIRQRAEAIRKRLPESDREEWQHLSWIAYRMLERLNRSIAVLRGPDFQLGHAYFWPVISDEDVPLVERRRRLFTGFADAILPQLQELLRDQPEELFAMLGGISNQQNGLYTLHTESDAESDLVLEPTGWLEFHPLPIEDIDRALNIVRAVARVEPDAAWPSEEDGSGVEEQGSEEPAEEVLLPPDES